MKLTVHTTASFIKTFFTKLFVVEMIILKKTTTNIIGLEKYTVICLE